MKVLCIDDDFNLEGLNINYPKKGIIYNVIGLTIGISGGTVYLLAEFPEYLWDSSAFKPITNKPTGHPCNLDNNKPSYSNAPIMPPVIVGIPGT